jgi:hypothetical protein
MTSEKTPLSFFAIKNGRKNRGRILPIYSGGCEIESFAKRNRVVLKAEIESFSKCPHILISLVGPAGLEPATRPL